MKYQVLAPCVLLATVVLLTACHQSTDDAKEAQRTAGDAAVFTPKPIPNTQAEQFGIGDPPPAAATTTASSPTSQR